MSSYALIRLPRSLHDAGKDAAKQQKMNFSQLVREALNPYLDGSKQYVMADAEIKETSVVISPEELAKVTELAKNANISRHEAIRIAIENYLDEHSNSN